MIIKEWLIMTLYENWMNKAFSKDGKSMEEVWDEFLPKEQKIYEYILGEKVNILEGAVSELALRFGVTPEEIVAFIDGINEVLPKPYEMNELEENSSVRLEIDFEKLYKKMVEYKAEHLYQLPQWNNIYRRRKKEFYKRTEKISYDCKR